MPSTMDDHIKPSLETEEMSHNILSPRYRPGCTIILDNPFIENEQIEFRITKAHSGKYGQGPTRSCVVTGIASGIGLPLALKDTEIIAKFFDFRECLGLRNVLHCGVSDHSTEAEMQRSMSDGSLESFLRQCDEVIDLSAVQDPILEEFDVTVNSCFVPCGDLIRDALLHETLEKTLVDKRLIPELTTAVREMFIWREMYRDFLRETEMIDLLQRLQINYIPNYYGHTQIVTPANNTCPTTTTSHTPVPVVLMEAIEGILGSRMEEIIHGSREMGSEEGEQRNQSIFAEFRHLYKCLQAIIHSFWDHGLEHTDLHPDNWMIRRQKDGELKLCVLDIGAVRSIIRREPLPSHQQQHQAPEPQPWFISLLKPSESLRQPSQNLELPVLGYIRKVALNYATGMERLSHVSHRFRDFRHSDDAAVWYLLTEDVRTQSRRCRLTEIGIMFVMNISTTVMTEAIEHVRGFRWAAIAIELMSTVFDGGFRSDDAHSVLVSQTATRVVDALNVLDIKSGRTFDNLNALTKGMLPRESEPSDSKHGDSASEAPLPSVDDNNFSETSGESDFPSWPSDMDIYRVDTILAAMHYTKHANIVEQNCWKHCLLSMPHVATYLNDLCHQLREPDQVSRFILSESNLVLEKVVSRFGDSRFGM